MIDNPIRSSIIHATTQANVNSRFNAPTPAAVSATVDKGAVSTTGCGRSAGGASSSGSNGGAQGASEDSPEKGSWDISLTIITRYIPSCEQPKVLSLSNLGRQEQTRGLTALI